MTLRCVRLFLGLACLALAPPALPASRGLSHVLVAMPPFSEQVASFSHYAGEALAGAVILPERAVPVGSVIVVSGVRPSDRTICVRIEQSNGGYHASFDVPNPNKGPSFLFVLPTSTIARLGIAPVELAIRARVSDGSSCNDNSPILAAGWGSAITPSIELLVNPQRYDRVSARVASGISSACSPALSNTAGDRRSMSSYSIVCRVRLTGACASEQEVVIQFRDGSIAGVPLRLAMRTPCPL